MENNLFRNFEGYLDPTAGRALSQITREEHGRVYRPLVYGRRFQQLASRPDIVERVKAEAREDGRIVIRQDVLKAITEDKRATAEAKREEQRQVNAAKVEKLATPLDAQGLFQTIVIDPPWDWGDEGDRRPRYVLRRSGCE